jgi:hypothetical protein
MRRNLTVDASNKMLWSEPLFSPNAFVLSNEFNAIMQPIRLALPKFKSLRNDSIPAPKRRPWDFTMREFLFDFR